MIKRIFLFLVLLVAICSLHAQQEPHRQFTYLDAEFQQPQREVRAVWLTTLNGLDWPKKSATTTTGAENQKRDLCRILDQLQAAGINTVIFQSRIRSTTAYPSAIEPWDGVFTGTPGRAPLYDPLQFALDECHRRGMEFHAWVVAFPICKNNVAKRLGKKALPSQRPELCQKCGEQWMMDPGVPGTDDYVAAICREIVTKYDIDGIHLDYIRYPEHSVSFNDNATYKKYGKGRNKKTWRRDNVTRCVKKIHQAVKSVRPWVKLSCSPVGKYADLPRQSSYGWNARDAVFQDAQGWLRDGLMDMLFPMMYFDGKHFYPFALDWQEKSYGKQIVPGLGIYFMHPREKDWDLNVIRRQMYFLRDAGLAGQAMFRSQFFTDNTKGLYDFAADDFYHRPALTPPMTWADSVPPTMPQVQLQREGHQLRFSWTPSTDNTPGAPLRYLVYQLSGSSMKDARLLSGQLRETSFTYPVVFPGKSAAYAVTAIDVYGNESAPCVVELSAAKGGTELLQTDRWLTIPEVDKAEFLLLCDAAGRQLYTLRYARKMDVSQLPTGYYSLRTLNEKGVSHRILQFWKK